MTLSSCPYPDENELHQDRITELVDLVQKAKAQALIFAKDPIAEPSAVIKIAFQCLQTTNSLVADLRKTFVMDEIENQKSKIQIQVSTANDDPPRKNPRLTRYHSNLLSGIALTEIRPEPVAPTGETVYMAACAVDRSLSVHPPHVVREAFTLYRTTLRVLLRVYNGYEVTEGNGLFLCAFGSAKNAIKWATDAQASLVSAAWPVEMTEAPKNVVYSSEDKTVLFRGVRAKAGVTAGKVDVVRDTVTDRMMYTGTVVDLVEWIRDYAHAGEVLMPKAVWDETKDDIECTNLSTQLLSRPIDEHEEDGTPLAAEVENLELMQVLPAVLQMRNAYWAGLNKRRSVESGIKSMQERGIAYCEVPAGDCVIVSTAIKNLDQLRESHPSATIKALYLYGEVLKRATAALHGRELSMADGYFKVAFQSAVDAAEFACRVQLKLLQCPWPFDMLDAHICRTILSKSGKVIHRGLRVKTGISCGAMSATYNELTTVDDLSGAAISEADTAMEMADGGQILLSEGVHQKLIENLPPLKDLDIELTELGTYDTPAVGQMELWEIRSTQLRERKFVLNSSPSQPPTPMADKRQLAAQGSVGDVATLLVLMKPYADTHDSKGLDLDTIPERRTHQPRVHLSEQSEPCELSALSIDQHAPPSTPCDSHTQTPVVLTPRCSTTAILGEAGDEDGEDGCTIETTRCSPSQASSAAGGASKSAGLRMSPRSVRSQAMAQSNKPSLSEREVSPSASPRRSSHTSTKQTVPHVDCLYTKYQQVELLPTPMLDVNILRPG
ncbi:hypothetical protein SARC_04170 [Sphaeroforma arctica JP610]|uniref:Guanylate cyclase domain-containing protein n=1 Tax=Sphaeroforma arctica JP610 TaxID=667725 RepID=A0A0L0G456_9EUKA|nr:hypothetical protein SARC_04170 [Sphaeroforma arctica JP610]KNC83586.1 hypothetical protein SARC_04170 [Sphaeroforma arctica JP610]|eukprot:XP_014157488.1 hypothetical protein SARC_04170 [Sphaeroforma arctica JP610]